LENCAEFDICPECGWEDDGQDDPYGEEVWGGPNGRLSLTEARAIYAGHMVGPPSADSVTRGGEGIWQAAARRFREQRRRTRAGGADTNG
jgi:hypothetical protein